VLECDALNPRRGQKVSSVADRELVERLRKSSIVGNGPRRENFADLRGAALVGVNLVGANLSEANLEGASLSNAKLRGAILSRTDLSGADLSGADLINADLSHANLRNANLSGCALIGANLGSATLDSTKLCDANLSGAFLHYADFRRTSLTGARLTNARLGGTVLVGVDLTGVIDLESCRHNGPSIVDFRTLKNSNPLPLLFLRGVGLPDIVIDYLPSLVSQAINYYSCFISYSAKDDDFAKRIHADLQSKGVRCWFAPHDLPIGGKLMDEIDAAIRLRDKLLIVLSKHSIESDWVEDEVKTAYEEERRRGQTVLFPIRLDDSVLETNEAWASKLRVDRNIGDFRQWKSHDRYQESLKRVLRDLSAQP